MNRIIVFIFAVILLLFFFRVFFLILDSSPIGEPFRKLWGTVDCGGIDPGFDARCYPEIYGKKRTCILFQCKITESNIPSTLR